MAHEMRSENEESELNLHAMITVRLPQQRFPEELFPAAQIWDDATGEWVDNPEFRSDDANPNPVLRRTGSNGDGRVTVRTTLGRLIFNEAFPAPFPFQNRVVKKKDVTEIVGQLVVMGVGGQREVGQDRAKMQHGGKLNTELARGVDGNTQLEGLADARRLHAGPDAAPERRIQKNNVDGGIKNIAG